MKKILLVLLILLCSCSSNDTIDKNVEYIEPVKEENLFDLLNEDTKSILKAANNGNDVENAVLKNLGKEMPEFVFDTIDDKQFDLNSYLDSKLVIEVVSIYCSHCKEQAFNNTPYIVDKYPDVTFVTYFVNGDKDAVTAFYKEIGVNERKDNEIVALKNDDFNDYLNKNYDFNATPSYYFFTNGHMTWSNIGTIDKEDFEAMYNFAFEQEFDTSNLISTDGESIFNYIRDINDVKEDLDSSKYAKLEALDNDDNTAYLTLSHIGQTFDFQSQYDDESNFKSEIDFSLDYTKDEIAFIFISGFDENLIDIINQFAEKNDDIKIFVINTSDSDNEEIADKLKAPLASIMNQIPKFLDSGQFGNYPSALFVQDSIITGIYSNILGIDELNSAKELFLGKDCIALNY